MMPDADDAADDTRLSLLAAFHYLFIFADCRCHAAAAISDCRSMPTLAARG